MTRINLLYDGFEDADEGSPTGNRPGETDAAESGQNGDQDKQVTIPRGESTGTEEEPVGTSGPQKSPFSRGPSVGFIAFLLLVTILVTVYYLFIQQPKDIPPTPVSEGTSPQTEVTQPQPTGTLETEPETGSPEQTVNQRPQEIQADTDASEQSTDRTQLSAMKVELAEHRVTSVIAEGQRQLDRFYFLVGDLVQLAEIQVLTISGGHIACTGRTRIKSDALTVRRRLEQNPLLAGLPVFEVTSVPTSREFPYQFHFYAFTRHQDVNTSDVVLHHSPISEIRERLKYWIGLPSVSLTSWRITGTEDHGQWMSATLRAGVCGERTSLLRVVNILRSQGYNFGVNKAVLHTEQGSNRYRLEFYLTLYGLVQPL